MAYGYLSEIFVSFQGEGAYVGEQHLFLRFAGCPLRCRYCDTPESLQRTRTCHLHESVEPPGAEWPNPLQADPVQSLVRRVSEQRPSVQKIAVTGGEPLIQWRFLRELLPGLRPIRPLLLETAGVHPEELRQVIDWLDLISMDIKLPSNSGEAARWEAHEAFLAVARQRRVYVKVLLDEATDEEEVEQALRLVERVGPDTPVFLQPIHSPSGEPSISTARLERFFGCARERLENVRVIPQLHKLLGLP